MKTRLLAIARERERRPHALPRPVPGVPRFAGRPLVLGPEDVDP